MSQEKYIGMDVHQATISVAVRDVQGKLIMESVLETKATTILEFVQGLRGTLALTFEEGTSVAWLHDLLPLIGKFNNLTTQYCARLCRKKREHSPLHPLPEVK